MHVFAHSLPDRPPAEWNTFSDHAFAVATHDLGKDSPIPVAISWPPKHHSTRFA